MEKNIKNNYFKMSTNVTGKIRIPEKSDLQDLVKILPVFKKSFLHNLCCENVGCYDKQLL